MHQKCINQIKKKLSSKFLVLKIGASLQTLVPSFVLSSCPAHVWPRTYSDTNAWGKEIRPGSRADGRCTRRVNLRAKHLWAAAEGLDRWDRGEPEEHRLGLSSKGTLMNKASGEQRDKWPKHGSFIAMIFTAIFEYRARASCNYEQLLII